MKQAEWRHELGEVVRQAISSPELDHYFRVKITKAGAQVLITQLGLFIRHRRQRSAGLPSRQGIHGAAQNVPFWNRQRNGKAHITGMLE